MPSSSPASTPLSSVEMLWEAGFGSTDASPRPHMGPLTFAAPSPGFWFQRARWVDPRAQHKNLLVTALCIASPYPHGHRLLIAQIDAWRVSAAMAQRLLGLILEKHPHGGPTTLWLVPTQSPNTPDLTGSSSRWPWSPGMAPAYQTFIESQTLGALSRAIYSRAPARLSLSVHPNPFVQGFFPPAQSSGVQVLHIQGPQGHPLGNVAYGWIPDRVHGPTPPRRISPGVVAPIRAKMERVFGGHFQVVLPAPGDPQSTPWRQRGDLKRLFTGWIRKNLSPSQPLTGPLQVHSLQWSPAPRPLWWPLAVARGLVEPIPHPRNHTLEWAQLGVLTLVALPGTVSSSLAHQLESLEPHRPLWFFGGVNDWALELPSPRDLALGVTSWSERALRQRLHTKRVEDLALFISGDKR